MKLVLLLLILFRVSEMANISEDELELERQVKIMNKPAVKTFVVNMLSKPFDNSSTLNFYFYRIYDLPSRLSKQVFFFGKPFIGFNALMKAKEGDIIDCVDINKQPALDHPLLKNHIVQVEPNLYFNGFEKFSPNEKTVTSGSREPCPIGTVPIPRVTKENLRRARSLPKMPSIAAVEHNALASNQHVVSLREDAIENVKYGCHGAVTVYNLTVAHDQFSSHNMWIETGPPDHISMIVAGWQVAPGLYGDNLSRLFTYWTGNGYQDGCYNVLCRGFIQIDRELSPGTPMRAASTYGRDVFSFAIRIDQDRDTGNWWLHCDAPPIKVGYWPKELFFYLRNGSLHTAWGGVGLAGSNGACPPMGSGHKPDGNFKHATYFKSLKWVSKIGDAVLPTRKISEWVDKSNVYGFKNHHVVIWGSKGYTISFGGPGGYCGG